MKTSWGWQEGKQLTGYAIPYTVYCIHTHQPPDIDSAIQAALRLSFCSKLLNPQLEQVNRRQEEEEKFYGEERRRRRQWSTQDIVLPGTSLPPDSSSRRASKRKISSKLYDNARGMVHLIRLGKSLDWSIEGAVFRVQKSRKGGDQWRPKSRVITWTIPYFLVQFRTYFLSISNHNILVRMFLISTLKGPVGKHHKN